MYICKDIIFILQLCPVYISLPYLGYLPLKVESFKTNQKNNKYTLTYICSFPIDNSKRI